MWLTLSGPEERVVVAPNHKKGAAALMLLIGLSGCCNDETCKQVRAMDDLSQIELHQKVQRLTTEQLWNFYLWETSHSRPPYSKYANYLIQRPDSAQRIMAHLPGLTSPAEQERAIDLLIEVVRKQGNDLNRDQRQMANGVCLSIYVARKDACAILL
jgi:hypothetical protein